MTAEAKVREAPATLGDAGRALFDAVAEEWDLRPDELPLLEAAAATADELGRLEGVLADADLVVEGSKGQERAHPLVAEVRAHRLALKQLLAAIGIREAAEGEGGNDDAQRSHAGRALARRRWN